MQHSIMLTAYKADKFRFLWGFDNVMEAKANAIRYMREGRGRRVEIHIGNRLVWCR